MQIQNTSPLMKPDGAPTVDHPVNARLSVPFSYFPQSKSKPVYCSALFAATVLAALEEWAKKYHFGLQHVGVYVARPARGANGRDIVPLRWSNHAYGCAVDWKGITDSTGQFIGTIALERNSPEKFKELLALVRSRVEAQGHRPEIVIEPGWVHLGYWPK